MEVGSTPTSRFIKNNKPIVTIFLIGLFIIGLYVFDSTPLEIINKKAERASFETIKIEEENLPIGMEYTTKEGRNGIQDRFEITFLNVPLVKNINILTNPISKEAVVGTSDPNEIVASYLANNSFADNFNLQCDVTTNEFLQLFRFTMYKELLTKDFTVLDAKTKAQKDFDGNIYIQVFYDTKYIDDSLEQSFNLYYNKDDNSWAFNCNSLNSLADLIKNRRITGNVNKIELGPFRENEVIKINSVDLVGANNIVFEEESNTCARRDYRIDIEHNGISLSLTNNVENRIRVTDSAFIDFLSKNSIFTYDANVTCRNFIESTGNASFKVQFDVE